MQQWYLPPSNYSCVSGVAFFSNNTSQHLSMRLAQVSFVVSQAAWLSPLVAPYNIYNHIMTTTSTKTLILTVRITISVYICSTILRSTLIIVLHTGRRMLYTMSQHVTSWKMIGYQWKHKDLYRYFPKDKYGWIGSVCNSLTLPQANLSEINQYSTCSK